ncbi:molybdenum cofactor biosynthesis protein MoaE [Rapidithrix thailandica]|uniref:Molybdopterin synthase catalytic subunit n=1 Tax=Rapidithrix thailandica TaxID=413964 RepID=A0AAW9S2M8_9BACT
MMFKIVDQPLNPQEVIDLVAGEEAGAIDVFIGTVRGSTQTKKVLRLEYEAYDAMAIREMEMLAEKVKGIWPVHKIAIYHRKGVLQVGDIAVVLAVSTPHRKEAFEACQYTIDRLKERVPIWKKEVFEDGEEWVAAHP